MIFYLLLNFRYSEKGTKFEKTSLKGFSASKCDIGNWIFSKSGESFGNFLGIFVEFCENSFGILSEFFWNSIGILLEFFDNCN